MAPRRLVVLALVVAGMAWLTFGANSGLVFLFAAAVPLAIVALGQDLILNHAGQASFGGAALAAVGGYIVVGAQHVSWLPFPIPLLVGGMAGGVVGVIIGLPGIRVRGLYLLLSTLALQVLVQYLGEELQGNDNISGFIVHAPQLGSITIEPGRGMLILSLIVLGAVCLFLDRIYRFGAGRAWQAVKEHEVATRVMGLPTVRWKLFAFVTSSVVSGVGGALYAYASGNVNYDTFSLTLAISIVVMVFVGGRETLVGPIMGAAFVSLIPYLLENLDSSSVLPSSAANWLVINGSNLSYSIYAALLLIVFVFDPDGIVGLVRRIPGLRGRRSPKRSPSGPTDGGLTARNEKVVS